MSIVSSLLQAKAGGRCTEGGGQSCQGGGERSTPQGETAALTGLLCSIIRSALHMTAKWATPTVLTPQQSCQPLQDPPEDRVAAAVCQ